MRHWAFVALSLGLLGSYGWVLPTHAADALPNCPIGIELGRFEANGLLPPHHVDAAQRTMSAQIKSNLSEVVITNPPPGDFNDDGDLDENDTGNLQTQLMQLQKQMGGKTGMEFSLGSKPSKNITPLFRLMGRLVRGPGGYQVQTQLIAIDSNGQVAQSTLPLTSLDDLEWQLGQAIDQIAESFAPAINCIHLQPQKAELKLTQDWKAPFSAYVTDLRGYEITSGIVRFESSNPQVGHLSSINAAIRGGTAETTFIGARQHGETRITARMTAQLPDGRSGMTTADSAVLTVPKVSVKINPSDNGKRNTNQSQNRYKNLNDQMTLRFKGDVNFQLSAYPEGCPITVTTNWPTQGEIPLVLDKSTGKVTGQATVMLPDMVHVYSGACQGSFNYPAGRTDVNVTGQVDENGQASLSVEVPSPNLEMVNHNAQLYCRCDDSEGAINESLSSQRVMTEWLNTFFGDIPWKPGATWSETTPFNLNMGQINLQATYSRHLSLVGQPSPEKPCKDQPIPPDIIDKATQTTEQDCAYQDLLVQQTYHTMLLDVLKAVGFNTNPDTVSAKPAHKEIQYNCLAQGKKVTRHVQIVVSGTSGTPPPGKDIAPERQIPRTNYVTELVRDGKSEKSVQKDFFSPEDLARETQTLQENLDKLNREIHCRQNGALKKAVSEEIKRLDEQPSSEENKAKRRELECLLQRLSKEGAQCNL